MTLKLRSAKQGAFPRLGGAGRVWVLNLILAAGAIFVALVFIRHLDPVPAPLGLPWWVLAVAFAITESFVVHIELRREAHSFSLSDIPLVLGLFFVTPVGLVLAQVVGAAAALAIRRQSPMKFAFNVGQFALTVSLAILVFHAVVGADPLGVAGLLGAFLATLTTTASGAIAITAAISLAEGRLELQTMRQGLGFGAVVAMTDTCLALIGAEIIWRVPEATWLLAIPAGLLFLAYRMYTVQRQKHEGLESLYASSRLLQRSLQVDSTMRTLLTEARAMFHGEMTEVTLFPTSKGNRALLTTLGPGETEERTESVELDPTEGVWARVASEGQAILLARPINNEKLREHFAARGIRDAMVAPLRGEAGVIGTMLLGNRLGAVSTFDEEDLKLFETLTNHASVALENAHLVGQLEESLAHLREMNRLKDDFVATVSHELRTPLTNIQGSIKTLLHLELREDDRRALLEAADRGSDRLRQLIEDLLMASRIESREVRPVVHPVVLSDLLTVVTEEVDMDIGGRRLELNLAPDLPILETDEGKLSQIVSNMLDNARKYSNEESTILLDAAIADEGVMISVINAGDPIPLDQRERIFDRFFQVDQTSTRVTGGAGLGLYICRKLAEAVGGRIWLERSDDQETAFRLYVPRTPPGNALSQGDPMSLSPRPV